MGTEIVSKGIKSHAHQNYCLDLMDVGFGTKVGVYPRHGGLNQRWTVTTYSGCDSPIWQGDNSCDDENNNANCNYDGGDCCGENVDTSWCTQCQCLDPAHSTTPISTESSTSTP